ncbi:FmtA-like protein [Streptomyces spiroverticillatus]|uniref:FmtA-like protein n=1 Tax=Streptomyces finlayi TaxID=67296 RepID=A0A918WXV4_9ACTN|nr:serine hydrolase domain-containing protein [Streptomyces finlayi]GHA12052.1 FmtA-like protein [Streptomyces spiroverticillatus]GHC94629.1 FmtA-like protein [Streptomyces finlayi]
MAIRRAWRRCVTGTLAGAALLCGTALPAQAAPAPVRLAPAPAPAAQGSPHAAPDPAAVRAFLDKEVPARLAARNIPGAAVTVVTGDRVLASAGYGVADLDRRTPVAPDRTRFFTGSVAKVFTAVAVLQQVDTGRLDLAADVNTYLTQAPFTIKDTYPGRPVTVGDLLTHTSGFDTTVLGVGTAAPEDAGSMEEYLRTRQPDRLRPPGTTASYDNYGLTLAGYLVEQVTGQSYASYVHTRIARPLGMTGTLFDQHDPRVRDSGTAVGYRPTGPGEQIRARGQFGPMPPTGAGTVTTAGDMGRLLQALLTDGRAPDGTRILTPRSTAALKARHHAPDPRVPGMAYVLTQDVREGRPLLLKDGDLAGFHGLLALLPDRATGLYVTFNGDGDAASAPWAARDLVNDFVARFFPASTPPKDEAAKDLLAADFEGTYRSTRTSHEDLSAAGALFGDVTVTVDPERGVLTTEGLSLDPDRTTRHWVPSGPYRFREQGGQSLIAFQDGTLLSGDDPTVSYTRSAWYASSTTHRLTLYATLGVLLTALLGLPTTALVRRLRHAAPAPGSTTARVLGLTAAALPIVFLGLFLTLAADPNALNEAVFLDDSPLLTGSLAALSLCVPVTGAALVLSVAARRRGWWSRAGRIHYTLVALSAALFLAALLPYHLVGWPWLTG